MNLQVVNSNTVLSFSDSRILNLYNPSKMSSCGIFVIDDKIPSHFESNSWISSFRRPLVNGSAYFSTESLATSDPEVIVDQVSNLSTAKETVLLLGFFVPPDWFSFWIVNYGWFCSMLKQSSHQVLQNSALKYHEQMAKILMHPLNQPTPLLWSIASLP